MLQLTTNKTTYKTKTMKKIFMVIMLVLFGLTFKTVAQTDGDKAKVVQVCLDLDDIQNLYPKDENGNSVAVHIMQYPIVLPWNIAVSKFGKSPVFMNREEIYDNLIDTYFLFQKLDTSEARAVVQFSLYYDQKSSEKKLMVVVLDLDKLNNNWIVVKKDIKKY